MRDPIEEIWRRLHKPPWVTIAWEAGNRYDGVLFYRLSNTKRRRWHTVKFEASQMFRSNDPHTIKYVAGVLQEGLTEVMANTIDAAVGSIDVYRDDN